MRNTMATAKTETRTVTKPVEVEVVMLELTMDEAKALREVVSRVGGPTRSSRRGLVDNILVALQKAGVLLPTSQSSDVYGSVTFTNKSQDIADVV
jgi:hypothetical protein